MELDRALELAVVSSWEELVRLGESCSIHFEYKNLSKLPLNSVEVWMIKNRGYGRLVCSYSMSQSHSSAVPPETLEIRFVNNFCSNILAKNFNFILRNQHLFSRLPDHSIHGWVQIDLPSDEEKKSAAVWSRGIRTDSTEDLAGEALQGEAIRVHF